MLKVGAGIATAISGGLIVVVLTLYFVASLAGIKDVAHPVRAGAQPPEGARR